MIKFSNIKPNAPISKGTFQMIIDSSKVASEDNLFDFGGFKPFVYQHSLIHDMEKRGFVKRGFIILPRRAGKTEVMVVFLLIQCFKKTAEGTDENMIQYGMVYPELSGGKEACWEKLISRTKGLPNLRPNSQQGSVSFELPTRRSNGKIENVRCRIKIVGLKNMDAKRGGGFNGLVIDEFGFVPVGFNKVISPMISDKVKQPTFLVKIGTPNEEGDFWEDYDVYKNEEINGNKEYYTFWSNYDKLKHIDLQTFKEMKLDMSQEEIDIEYNCLRGVVSGAKYYTEEIKALHASNRVLDIQDNVSQKKILVCDIGASKRDLFAMFIVQFNALIGRFELIDYEEIASANEMKVFDWVQSKGYVVGQIILPWDGKSGMRTPEQLFREKFPMSHVYVLPRDGKSAKINRIHRSRALFNKVAFDTRNTLIALNHLKSFSKKWDPAKKLYKIDPNHDIHSHCADAFGHLAQAHDLKKLEFSENFDIYGRDANMETAKSYDPMASYMGGGY